MPYGSSATGLNSYEKSCLPKDATGFGCAYYLLSKNKMDY